MGAGSLLVSLGIGVSAELILYLVLVRIFGLQGKAAATAVALVAVLIYVPWAIINWAGADIFSVQLAIFLTLAYGLGMVGSRVGRGWHWAPAIIVAFFVGVIVINVIFVSVSEKGITGLFAELLPKPRAAEVADSQFPGVVSHDYQEKEALYNEYLRQVEAQQARGWQVRKGWAAKPEAGLPQDFIVKAMDREGKPITGAMVRGSFLRTSHSDHDFEFALQEVGRGEYRGSVVMPLHGLWKMVLWVRKGDDLHEIRATTSVKAAPSVLQQ